MGDYDYPEFDRRPSDPPEMPPEPVSEPAPEPISFQPWKDIWRHPRVTVRRLVAFDATYMVLALAALSGINESIGRSSMHNSGDSMNLTAIILIAVIGGSLGGLLSLWVSSFLVRWSGSWFGGTAPRSHLRTALAWSMVPQVVALILTVPQLMLFGRELFTTLTPRIDGSSALTILLVLFGLVELVLGIWTVVLLANTVAEVQGYRSAWKGLGNMVAAGAVILVPIMLAVFFFAIIGQAF